MWLGGSNIQTCHIPRKCITQASLFLNNLSLAEALVSLREET